jgi:hypothetical protein
MKERTKETKARFRVRSLPGLLEKNGRQIRTQHSAGPAYPKTAVVFLRANADVCGFLECTKVYRVTAQYIIRSIIYQTIY